MKNNEMDYTGEFWFLEKHSPGAGLALKVRKHLFTKQTDYQLIEIFDTYDWGRVLTLDRLVMLTQRDEAAYHEMMVHVPMLSHPHPRKVLVVGGGDGGCLRELVKYPQLEKAVQVEIDREVVKACLEYFPEIASAYENHKVDLQIQDALKYIKNTDEKFDVIIVDSSDPVGPAVGLFNSSFFEGLYSLLNDDGILVNQLGSPFYSGARISESVAVLRNFFCDVQLYTTQVTGYPSGVWGIGYAAKKESLWQNPDNVRYDTSLHDLKYYNLETHRASFMLPEYCRRLVMGK